MTRGVNGSRILIKQQLLKCPRTIIIMFECPKRMNDNSVSPHLAILMAAITSTEALT